jgi:hypothetical protein
MNTNISGFAIRQGCNFHDKIRITNRKFFTHEYRRMSRTTFLKIIINSFGCDGNRQPALHIHLKRKMPALLHKSICDILMKYHYDNG